MAMVSHRLRRAITVVSSLTRLTFVTPKSESALISASSFLRPSAEEWPLTAPRWSESTARMFSSTRQYKLYKEGDEITPDSVLFEGCDYNHWLITMDFPKDNPPSSEEMIATYEQTCAKGLGISLEEAKTKIYACSTTTYQGFQAIMTEEESDKFKDIPGVVFILPDSYIDPVNKEYGGDKYENGVITPRPPPVQYGRSRPRDRSRNFDQPRFDRQANPSQNFQGNPQNRQPMPPAQGDGRGYGPPQNFPSQQQNYGPSGQGGYPGGQGSTRPPYQGNFSQRAPGSYNQGAPGNFNSGAPGNFNSGAPGNFNSGTPGNFNSGAPGNFNSGAPGNFNQGAPGNFNQGAPGNFNQGAPDSINPGAPGNFNPGAPGNFNPGAPGNFSQGAPGNNNQGPQGNYYPQGGNRNYGPQGGNYGQPGNPGYGQGYAGQGPGQGFPQNDQNHAAEDWRNINTMGQPGTDRGKF